MSYDANSGTWVEAAEREAQENERLRTRLAEVEKERDTMAKDRNYWKGQADNWEAGAKAMQRELDKAAR